ncbi:hypothetical protein [Flavihumibacter sp. ZG627]|uniref:hypothetical protein n=1 Tax=Flavihumibacter sp. ZG627 TaxID=1463156 RepID=UPI00057FD76F|nr:hypothetical protein [Flavihumibacter sp. ZG627]KIC92579.1 hypothetical protein HY58_03360 [Flavihumibacter sp. ZG627]
MPPQLINRAQFLEAIVAKAIFRFATPELNTITPHFFICIVVQPDDIVVLSCCTSQYQTVKRIIAKNRFPASTQVLIDPSDPANPFNRETYINCNEYFPFGIDELMDLYDKSLIEYWGALPEHSFHEIIQGFLDSPQIEEELKELLNAM